jgi:hypothetical protein
MHNAEVTYDGARLQFPGGYEEDAISQTRSQALWLQKWLSSAVGDKITVKMGTHTIFCYLESRCGFRSVDVAQGLKVAG